jgi:hypothetical protein
MGLEYLMLTKSKHIAAIKALQRSSFCSLRKHNEKSKDNQRATYPKYKLPHIAEVVENKNKAGVI